MRASAVSSADDADGPAPRRRRSRKAESAATILRETETGFMRRIIEYAQLRSWSTFHDEHSLWNERGLPDLILARWPCKDSFARLIFAETKATGGRLRVEQAFWLETLRHVQSVEVYVWKPADWDEIQRILF